MSAPNSAETQLLDLINQDRLSAGLAALTFSDTLNDAAEDHSAWMLAANTFSHAGVSGSTAHDRMISAGYAFQGNWASGENIAYQSERGAPGIADDVVDLHASLMNSPGHRANILDPSFTQIGIGIETGAFTTQTGATFDAVMVTQNFAFSIAANPAPGGLVADFEPPNAPTPPPQPDIPSPDPVPEPAQDPLPDPSVPDTPPDNSPQAEDEPDLVAETPPTAEPEDAPDVPSESQPETPDGDADRQPDFQFCGLVRMDDLVEEPAEAPAMTDRDGADADAFCDIDIEMLLARIRLDLADGYGFCSGGADWG